MIRLVQSELRLTTRRPMLWLATLLLIVLACGVTRSNVETLHHAQSELRELKSEHAVGDCVSNGTTKECPPPHQSVTITETDKDGSTASHSVALAYVMTPADQWRLELTNARDVEVPALTHDMQAARAPSYAVAAIGTAPGLVVATFVGALVFGGEYTWGVSVNETLAAGGRRRLAAARLAVLAITAACWLVLGTAAAATTHALIAHTVEVPAFAWPHLHVAAIGGAWLVLMTFAALGALITMLTRSSLAAATAVVVGGGALALLTPGRHESHGPQAWIDVISAATRDLAPIPRTFASTVAVVGTHPGSVTAAVGLGIVAAWLVTTTLAAIAVTSLQDVR